MKKATAKANTNIALIKYWGKRDDKLFLPNNSSISITLDHFHTTTTVEFQKELTADSFALNDVIANETETRKISAFMDKVRKVTGESQYAKISSLNNVPTAAGFASSASGYAALAAAAVKATNGSNDRDKQAMNKVNLSILARQGSGSACRSIEGGFVIWEKGHLADGSDSYGKQILNEKDWKLTILSVIVDSQKKSVSSRDGMRRTVETSIFYSNWLNTIEEDLDRATSAIKERNFKELGEVMEENALKMHASMMGAKPPIIYWTAGTMEVIHCVQELRLSGIPAYFTIDAGANVKVLCEPGMEKQVKMVLSELRSVKDIIACYPGQGIRYL